MCHHGSSQLLDDHRQLQGIVQHSHSKGIPWAQVQLTLLGKAVQLLLMHTSRQTLHSLRRRRAMLPQQRTHTAATPSWAAVWAGVRPFRLHFIQWECLQGACLKLWYAAAVPVHSRAALHVILPLQDMPGKALRKACCRCATPMVSPPIATDNSASLLERLCGALQVPLTQLQMAVQPRCRPRLVLRPTLPFQSPQRWRATLWQHRTPTAGAACWTTFVEWGEALPPRAHHASSAAGVSACSICA